MHHGLIKNSSYYNNKTAPYEFKLLYHSSRDGFNDRSVNNKCDGKGATIWVATIQGSTQLIGGYNSLDWSKNGQSTDSFHSFLFNFPDGRDLSTVELRYFVNKVYTASCGENSYIRCLSNNSNGSDDPEDSDGSDHDDNGDD